MRREGEEWEEGWGGHRVDGVGGGHSKCKWVKGCCAYQTVKHMSLCLTGCLTGGLTRLKEYACALSVLSF